MSFCVIVEEVLLPMLSVEQAHLVSQVSTLSGQQQQLFKAYQSEPTKSFAVRSQHIHSILKAAYSEVWESFLTSEKAEEAISKLSQRSNISPSLLQAAVLLWLENKTRRKLEETKASILKKEQLSEEISRLSSDIQSFKRHNITAESLEKELAQKVKEKEEILDQEKVLSEYISEIIVEIIVEINEIKNFSQVQSESFRGILKSVKQKNWDFFEFLVSAQKKYGSLLFLNCLDSAYHPFSQLVRRALFCYVAIADDKSWDIHFDSSGDHSSLFLVKKDVPTNHDQTSTKKREKALEIFYNLHRVLRQLNSESSAIMVQSILKHYQEEAEAFRPQDLLSHVATRVVSMAVGTNQRFEKVLSELANLAGCYFVLDRSEVTPTQAPEDTTLAAGWNRFMGHLGWGTEPTRRPSSMPKVTEENHSPGTEGSSTLVLDEAERLDALQMAMSEEPLPLPVQPLLVSVSSSSTSSSTASAAVSSSDAAQPESPPEPEEAGDTASTSAADANPPPNQDSGSSSKKKKKKHG